MLQVVSIRHITKNNTVKTNNLKFFVVYCFFLIFADEMKSGRGHTVPFVVEINNIMITKDAINQSVEIFFNDTEFYLVDLVVTPDQRIIIEMDAYKGVSIDDCVRLNRYLTEQFSPEIEDYELEVSSAGITEPFKVVRQYHKNLGKEVEVLTREGKKITGVLSEVSEESFQIQVEKKVKEEGAKRKTTIQETLSFTYNEIKTTKMIIRFK